MTCAKTLFSFLSILLVAACGGGGAGSGGVAASISPPPPPITGRFNVPDIGISNYSGFMTLNLPVGRSREQATGNLSLTIDFGSNSDQVTGAATGFSMPSAGALTGQIFLTGGSLRAEQGNDPPGFEGDISGTLRGGLLVNTLITGELDAEFDTTDVSTASGIVFGDVTTSQGIDIFDGSVSVAKQ